MISLLPVLSLTACVVTAAPSISLPVNAQVPPVARTGKQFSFTFTGATFSSSGGDLVYATSNSPGWLDFDNDTRTFSGTPTTEDAGSCEFSIVARDNFGSTSMPVTLVVSESPGPGLGTSVEDQLITQNGFSSPETLLIPHSSPVSLTFSPDTFTNTNSSTVYYAMSADHSPLPSWIHFSPNNLSFSGETPSATSDVELPQTYPLEITASDVTGFAGAIIYFQIIVERRFFTFTKSLHLINVTSDLDFTYMGLQGDLSLDGQIANSTEVANITTNGAPPWLSLDPETFQIAGTPPKNVPRQNFTVSATDTSGDTTNTTVLILSNSANTSVLLTALGTYTAKAGCQFQYDFHMALISANADLSVSLGTASSWLEFDVSSLKLKGQVPSHAPPQTYAINVTASEGSQKQTETLSITVVTTNPTDASTSACPTAVAPMASTTALGSGSMISKNKRWIALIVVLPVVVAMIALFLFAFFRRRRRRWHDVWETESSTSSKGPVSPILEVKEPAEENVKMSGALEPGQNKRSSKMSLPPTIDVPGLWRSVTGTRLARRPSSKASFGSGYPSSKRDSWHSYAFHFNLRPKSSALPENGTIEEETASPEPKRPSQITKTNPNFSRFSVSSYSSPSNPHSRSRQTRSNMSLGSLILQSNAMNGLGHGRSIRSQGIGRALSGTRGIGHGDTQMPPGFGSVRDSWRNPRLLRMLGNGDSSSSKGQVSGHSLSKSLNPLQVSSGHDKPSVRLVTAPSQEHFMSKPTIQISDMSRPSTAQRTDQLKRLQEFHRKRVLLKNSERALFTAGPSSSRVSSYGASFAGTPAKHVSNSKARLSPRRHPHASDVPSSPFAASIDLTQIKHRHNYSLSDVSDPKTYSQYDSDSPDKLDASPQEQRYPRQSPSLGHVRLPLIGRPSRKSSVMSDDFDSRWESASSDAASMDPYIYSHDPQPGPQEGQEKEPDLRSRRRHSQPLDRHHQQNLHPRNERESKERNRLGSPAPGSTTRFRMERLAQGIKRLSYGRAEREASPSEDGGDDDEDGEDRGRRRRVIRMGGAPGRSVLLGQGVVGARQGEPGNTSFRGDITGPRDHGDNDDGTERAFV